LKNIKKKKIREQLFPPGPPRDRGVDGREDALFRSRSDAREETEL
jgi:hypothetical protein